MMNKSKIDWCDFTWNPVTGCRHGCEYCYAEKIANRFCGNVMINKGSDQLKQDTVTGLWYLPEPFRNENGKVVAFPVKFEPTFREYVLPMVEQKKKPANIFVCSMADLFGEWVPDDWIRKVFDACDKAPWHRYLFLTKNPSRYCRLHDADILPKSRFVGDEIRKMWFGTTLTKNGQPVWDGSVDFNTFVSIEPMLEEIEVDQYGMAFGALNWIIIGAETGNRQDRVKPKPEWVERILRAADNRGIPVFMKNNLKPYWPGQMRQEFPWNE